MRRLIGLAGLILILIITAVWAGNHFWLRTPPAERVTDVTAAFLNGGDSATTALGRPDAERDLAPFYEALR